MIELNKGQIVASNDNQNKTEQVVGSDVEKTMEDSQQVISTLDTPKTSFELPASLPDPINDNNKEKLEKIDGTEYSQKQIQEAISSYGLEDALKYLVPSDYQIKRNLSITDSITQLLNDLKLSTVLKSIKKRPGVHPKKGLPSKRALVMHLFGLNRYATEQIEALDLIWVRKAIKFALKNKILATSSLVKRLKKENQTMYEKFKAAQAQEAKKQDFANKIANAPQATNNQIFDGALVDLTQKSAEEWAKIKSLPLSKDALVFVATTPASLPHALGMIETFGLSYVDNVVWNRDRIKGQYPWSKNQHTNILVATKGELALPLSDLRLESIHFDHQNSEQTDLPDYFFSAMENLIPGGNFMEVFSARCFSKQWFLFGAKGGQNV